MSNQQVQNQYHSNILENTALVVSITKYFNPKTQEQYNDYFQCGMMALTKAVKTFNPEKGTISTYATYAIKWSILNFIRNENKYNKKKVSNYVERAEVIKLPNPDILDGLSKEEQNVVIDHIINEKSIAEICRNLNKTRSYINKVYNKAVKKLKKSV